MIINQMAAEEKPNSYSVSRLKVWQECSQKYYNTYILKLKTPNFSESTVIGSLVHDALEYLYSTEDPDVNYLMDAFKKTTTNTLTSLKIVSESEATYLNEMLWSYALDIITLYDRASADYTGKDAIRKADGSVSQSPQMTSGWKKAEKELKLADRKHTIDMFVVDKNSEFEGLSMCTIFAEAYNICKNYRTPGAITEVLSVEMPISHWNSETKTIQNVVPMPSEFGGKEGILLNGYIDAVIRVIYNGKEVTALIDHKTSKSAYTTESVAYNRQLMAYVYAYEYLTGETVGAIGINNLRSNTLVLAAVDRDIMKDSLNNLFFSHKLITAEVFIKAVPEDNYSKCLNSFGGKCTYLGTCYPELFKKLEEKELSFVK